MKKLLFILLSTCSVFCAGAQIQVPQLIANIAAGNNSGQPTGMTAFSGKLYFAANNGVSGNELWSYDGVNGPSVAFDIFPGAGSGVWSGIGAEPKLFVLFNGRLYFAGDNGSTGMELFSFDGSNPPSLAADINPGSAGSYPEQFCVLGNKLYFKANTVAKGSELFSFDGFNPPVQYDINRDTAGGIGAGSNPASLTVFKDKLYFSADSGRKYGNELFTLDPITGSIRLVQNINGGDTSSSPYGMVVLGSKMYFVAYTNANGTELYSYDGNVASRLTDIAPGTGKGVYTAPVIYNDKLFYSGSGDGVGYQLHKYDTLKRKDTLVAIINQRGDANIRNFYVHNNELYFAAIYPTGKNGIWSYNDIVAKMAYSASSGVFDPYGMVTFNGDLYFGARSYSAGTELYSLTESTGIKNTKLNGEAFIHPNPAITTAILDLTLQSAQSLRISLIDMSGREVFSTGVRAFSAGRNEVRIPVQSLASGQYFYQITGTGSYTLAGGSIIRQ